MIKASDFWHASFISYRRYLLDQRLNKHKHLMSGLVVDLGGKREHKRGAFRPPEESAKHWWYVNMALDTMPDILADVSHVPLAESCADCIICTEVLEHLTEPSVCVEEAYRLLKIGGALIASVPFLYPVHGDPQDYQRFTADGLRHLCRRFSSVRIESMGGFLGTIGMLLELGTPGIGGWRLVRGAIKRVLIGTARVLYWLDARNGNQQPNTLSAFTTGYFVTAVK